MYVRVVERAPGTRVLRFHRVTHIEVTRTVTYFWADLPLRTDLVPDAQGPQGKRYTLPHDRWTVRVWDSHADYAIEMEGE